MNMNQLEDIPNQNGFRFIGICRDGSEIECIIKEVDECCSVRTDDAISEPIYRLLKSWRHRTESDV
jgi:hypothetical protein